LDEVNAVNPNATAIALSQSATLPAVLPRLLVSGIVLEIARSTDG
jgi:hypothetical protein